MLRVSRILLPVLSVLGLLAVLLGSMMFVTPAKAATLCYVKANAAGANNGTSWADAYTSLQSALGASPCTEIWVAAGTYKPTSGADRAATFQLKSGVALYGGFAGTETARNQRDPATNVTILSGDIGTVGNNADNSYHTVSGSGTDATAVLDGFSITDGNANGVSPGERGGGMYNLNGSPTLRNVSFIYNTALYFGGGTYNDSGNPTMTNVTFTYNSVTDPTNGMGGGLLNLRGNPILTNVTFSGNSSPNGGGGMHNNSGSATLINVTFNGNTIGMRNSNSTVTIKNSLFWGDTAAFSNSGSTVSILDSVVQNGCPSGSTCTNVINSDPKLGTLGNYGGYTQTIPLLSGSSAIDAGDNATCASTDQRGVTRPQGAACDIGAFEVGAILYAKPGGALSNSACDTWSTACELRYALTSAIAGREIWVATGTYKPSDTIDRAATFQLKSGVALYGGFTGTETARDQRNSNPATNGTILSGEIGAAGNSDNSYHVVTGATGATLDGFTITAGNANGTGFDSSGGGMYNEYFSEPTLANVTFSGNSAANNGGGMFTDNSNLVLTNVSFDSNSAIKGGGIYSSWGGATLTNAIFSGNTASYGGGMYNDRGGGTLTNVTFSGNMATSGGGMYGTFDFSTLTNVAFNNNEAISHGGGIYVVESHSQLTNVTFNGNEAANGGGMTHASVSSSTLTNVTFSGNKATDKGGGLENLFSDLVLTNVTFNSNSSGNGGGIYTYYDEGWNFNIRNVILWGNTATMSGEQIYAAGVGIVSINSGVVQGGCPTGSTCTNIITADPKLGTLGDYGGYTQSIPLLPGSSAIDVGNNTYCPSTDQRGVSRPQGAACDIGAFESTGAILYAKPGGLESGFCNTWATACELRYALFSSIGQEIWVAAGTYKPTSDIYNRYATFDLKSSMALYGGFVGTETARDQRNPAANVTILSGDLLGDDSGFTNNNENSLNVVVCRYQNNVVLDGFKITGGNANMYASADPWDRGGGIHNDSCNLSLTNMTISGNSAINGGGMCNYNSSPVLTNVTFSGNSASSGGGGISNHYHSEPVLTNVTFNGNSADRSGGGMYNVEADPALISVTFSSNSATEGGGIYNYESSPMLTAVTFNANTAVGFPGGGMYNTNDSSPILTNVTFSGNSASRGGGMFNRDHSTPTLTSVTFSSNSATEGGGMYNFSSPQIRNAIFWGNTGGQIDNDLYISAVISDSVVQGGYASGTNIITADPKLGALGDYGGYTQTIPLLTGSSAIDAGDNASCPATDQRGITRPQNNACDIGAYEVEYAGPAVTINQAAGQADPTNARPILFDVLFSEFVTGFDGTDVELAGTSSGGEVSVTGSGLAYTVSVSGMTSGTVIVSIPARAAQNAFGKNSRASTSSDNTVTYDGTRPNTSIARRPDVITGDKNASFSFTGTDNRTPGGNLKFQCSLDGGGFSDCGSPMEYPGLSVGSHTFKVRARDAVGNLDRSPAAYSWMVVEELLGNGSFESALGAGNWQGYNLVASDKRIRDASAAKDGKYSWHFGALPQKRSRYIYQVINRSGAAGDTFTFKIWNKTRGIQPAGGLYQAKLIFYDGSDSVHTRVIKFKAGTHNWQLASLTFSVPANHTRIEVRISVVKTVGEAWFDAASLTLIP